MSLLDLEYIVEADLPVDFGRYTLTGILGAGGMGRVFRAELRGPSGFRKELALKVIARRDGSSSERLKEEFFREARFSGLLKHENVVDVYDFGVEEGRPWLAMELLRGRSLAAILRDGPLPPTAALDLALQLCAGLTHAHGLVVDGEPVELVHRDLKPANIVVTPRGVAKILDFGLARSAGSGTELTGSGTVRGTPAYMAPEQARTQDLDARTDLFALGLVLYEALTGRCLLARENLMAVMMALVQLEATLQDPEVIRPAEEAVPGIAPVLAKVLKSDPAERYARAAELAADLRLLLQTLPPGPGLRAMVGGEEPGPSSGSVVAPVIIDTLPHASQSIPGTHSTRPSQALARRTNLAPDTAAFVGRASDLAAIQGAVEDGMRLITILGPGGTGKTRLARRYAAGRLGDLLPHGGVWFCDLSEATTLDGILHVVGVTLGVPLDRSDHAAETIGHAIADRGRMLLILDNVEQIVGPASELIDDWLRWAPGLQLLVTSRERLRLPSEQVVDLGPLTEEEAVALFGERAKAVNRNFALKEADLPVIGEIVRRLDCLPLAVELAAARVSVMAPRKIRDRLDQRFRLLSGGRRSDVGRQSTLRATIRWSWDLLDAAEQDALAQCSIFRGGFTLEAAEQIVDLSDHEDAPWTLDVVQALRDKSLLHSRTPRGLGGDIRFGMYESLREFASEQLAARGGFADVALRHARTMADLGEDLAPGLEQEGGKVARLQLALELDNLDAACTRVRETDVDTSLRAALAMIPMLDAAGPMKLLRSTLDRAVADAEAADSPRLCRLVLWRARLHRNQGSREDSFADARRGVELARAQDDPSLLVRALVEHSMALVMGGDPIDSVPRSEEAVAIARAGDDPEAEALALYAHAYGLSYVGELARSRALMTEALERWTAVGNLRYQANALSSIAVDDANAGKIDAAEPLIRRSLTLHRRIGSRRGEGMCQANLALIALQRGNIDEAQRRATKALEIHRAHGNRMPAGATLCNLGCIELLRGNHELAVEHFREGDRLLTIAGNHFYCSIARRDLAIAATLIDRLEEAEEAARGAVEAAEMLPDQRLRPCAEVMLGAVLAVRGDLTEADTRLHFAQQRLEESGDTGAEVAVMNLGLAFRDVALARQIHDADPGGAAELVATARATSDRYGYPEDLFEAGRAHDSTLQIMKVALDHHIERTAD